jgi:nicotinamidase-related amidase
VVFECQDLVLGENGPYQGLVRSARSGMLERLARFLDEARSASVPVIYCTISGRPGGLGSAKTPMGDLARASGAPRSPGGTSPVVAELTPVDGDVIVDRSHGMSAFHGTELDTVLRSLGVDTVITTGVSANLGVIGTAIEAVNHGYRVVVPGDCIASDPPEYREQILRYSYRNLAYVTTADRIAEVWAGHPAR